MANHRPRRKRFARTTDGVCPNCGKETVVWRGGVHKWRCAACVASFVGIGFRPTDARTRRERIGRLDRPVLAMPDTPTTHPEETR